MKTLVIIVGILFIIFIMTLIIRACMEPVVYIDDGEDEVTTTTTTTTTTTYDEPVQPPAPQEPLRTFVGNLQRQREENGQPYVMDPVDNVKWMLNTTDTWYEDANGRFWNLV